MVKSSRSDDSFFARLLMIPLLLATACVMAGTYGSIHNQISYSVSPEYFHDFKFILFRMPAAIHNRVGAATVGWFASWWMGLLISVPILAVGLTLPRGVSYFRTILKAFSVVVLTAFAVGLTALAISYGLVSNNDSLPPMASGGYPTHAASFARAGFMHNFSYLGGAIGILTGSGFLLWVRYRHRAAQVR